MLWSVDTKTPRKSNDEFRDKKPEWRERKFTEKNPVSRRKQAFIINKGLLACAKVRSGYEKAATFSANHARILSFAIIVATLTLSYLY